MCDCEAKAPTCSMELQESTLLKSILSKVVCRCNLGKENKWFSPKTFTSDLNQKQMEEDEDEQISFMNFMMVEEIRQKTKKVIQEYFNNIYRIFDHNPQNLVEKMEVQYNKELIKQEIDQNLLLSMQEKIDFASLLETVEYLSKFLHSIINSVPENAKSQIFFLIYYICEEYLIRDPFLSEHLENKFHEFMNSTKNQVLKQKFNLFNNFSKFTFKEEFPEKQNEIEPFFTEILASFVEITISVLKNLSADFFQENSKGQPVLANL